MSVFVDTSVFYAAMDAGDTHNQSAKEILAAGYALVTTDHVLVETWHLVRARSDWAVAETLVDRLRRSVRVEMVQDVDMAEAHDIGRRYPDQDFSIVDRTSFAVMTRLGLTRAASFDSDFAVYRYGRDNRIAFEVLR